MELIDRFSERRVLDEVLRDVRAGQSRVVVLHGEPGVGKSVLMDYVAERAEGCRLFRATGVESEMELPYAALHQLCVPVLNHLDRLPGPQRDALSVAFGIRSGPTPERFLTGLAVLTLFSEVAGDQPLVCLVDDLQWLDHASAQALSFVARRLGAEPVGMVLATRVVLADLSSLTGMQVKGLRAADAQALLKRLVAERWLTANAVVGFWPANATGDDIELYADEARGAPHARLHTLRQQMGGDGKRERANTALADFVAPKESGLADYVGAFAVTSGIGEADALARHIDKTDDYGRIMLKALADRLAEAFAERMHERVRRELWGYAPGERLSAEELIAESYQGIRPAPGYPAQPDHTEKGTIFKLLDAEAAAGIALTESFAMWPGAAVSGLYFSHPDSHYFGVGKVERDQVEDYAARKGWSVEEAERWLGPVLNYDPKLAQSVAA